jgi:hypothetical protein
VDVAELCLGRLLEQTLLMVECAGYALHFFCGCFWGCWHSSRLLLEKTLACWGFNFSLLLEYKKNGFFCFSVLCVFYFVLGVFYFVLGFSFFSCGNLLLG